MSTQPSPQNALQRLWWHTPQDEILSALGVDSQRGLSDEQVEQHRSDYGANTLEEARRASVWELILDGVKEPMMIVLLSIAGLSFLFGKPVEALVMMFVVAAYIGVEFINKFRSERVMTRLRELTQPTAIALRRGQRQEIAVGDLVVGDIILLTEGGAFPPTFACSKRTG